MFEIYYLPMNVELGVELPETSAMLVSLPPRRVQRSRSQDIVSIYVTVLEGEQLPAHFLENILAETAGSYYNSAGSITSGLRTAANFLNSMLLEFNKEQHAHNLPKVTAALNMGVLKGDLLSVVHGGPSYSALLQPGRMQLFESDQEEGRGLGVSASLSLRFFQLNITPESLVMYSALPSEKWTERGLTHGSRLTINLLRRRLLAHEGESFQAGLMQFKPSDHWDVHHLRLRSLNTIELPQDPAAQPVAAEKTPASETAQTTAESETQPPEPITPAADPAPARAEAAKRPPVMTRRRSDEAETITHTPDLVRNEPVTYTSHPARADAARQRALARQLAQAGQEMAPLPVAPPAEKIAEATEKPDARQELAALGRAGEKTLASTWQSLYRRQQKINQSAGEFFGRVLPGSGQESAGLSKGFLLLIAVLVPLIVVAAAVSIYMQQGRDQQFQVYYDQAVVYAGHARAAADDTAVRNNWQQVLYWLDLAEDYQKTDGSRGLRREANTAMDALEGIIRLDFRELYPYGFDDSLTFSQIAVTDTDVYLLDANGGSVIRMVLTGQGYKRDENFSCGPGASGTLLLGAFVDIAALPAGGPHKATVMGVDGKGSVAYCIPGQAAPITAQLPSPENGWGMIKAISLDQGSLYVLDAQRGMVYLYNGFTAGYADEALPFFDAERDEALPDLASMIDLTAYGEALYLLNKNGTVAHCTSGIWEIYQTRCEDPAVFGDMRDGKSEEPLLLGGTKFTQIQTSAQPEPSLYLLDTLAPTVYRFSLKLNLDRLFQPDTAAEVDIPKPPATAFTITPTRDVFIAFGNKVFYASQRD